MTIIHNRRAELEAQAVAGVVYLATPLPMHRTKRLGPLLGRARSLFPYATILRADRAYTSNEDWIERWPHLVPSLDGLVFVTELGAIIGLGIAKEVSDVQAARKPVFYLDASKRLHSEREFQLTSIKDRTARYFAQVQLAGE